MRPRPDSLHPIVYRILHSQPLICYYRVPAWPKAILALGMVYLLSPIDLIPDFSVPGLGYVDDLFLLLLALRGFIAVCPTPVVREHLLGI